MRRWPTLLSIALLSVDAWAQAPPQAAPPDDAAAGESANEAPLPNPKREAAIRLFNDAETLRKANNCERAVPLYLQSRALVASVPNTLNGAVCLTDVGRGDEALELYAELLGALRTELTEAELTAVGAEMNRLRATLAAIDVAGDVGAALIIDGRRRAVLPLASAVPVTAGAHDVRLVKEGFEPFATVVAAAAGRTTAIRATLRALTHAGRVRVSGLEGAELFVDGAPIGVVPFEGTLAAGEHVYQVIGGDSGSAPATMTVIAGQTVLLAPEVSPMGSRLDIRAQPEGALIRIGGVAVGRDRWLGRLPVGRALLEVSLEGYHSALRTLDIAIDDSRRELLIELDADREHPQWTKADEPRLWVEVIAGVGVAPSLGSGAEQSCGRAACADDPVAIGVMLGARAGYELPMRLSIELSGGFLALGKDLERRFDAGFDDVSGNPVAVSYSMSDALRVRAGFVGGGVGYRWPVAGPFELTGHLTTALMFVTAKHEPSGTASGESGSAALAVAGADHASFSINVLVAPELKAALRFDALSFGIGVRVAYVALASASAQLGEVFVTGACQPTAPRDIACAPGEGLVRDEAPYGPFFLVVPSAHLGYLF